MWQAVLVMLVGAATAKGPTHAIDHIGIGCADLDAGIAFVAERTGVTAERGGVHPGRGTQNALLSLGGGTYLEIIAPVAGEVPAGDNADLAKLRTPEPVFFAVRSTDLDATARLLAAQGFETTAPRAGSRKRPDGSLLKWRTLGVKGAGDAAPFFIQWDAATPHPSTTSPAGCTLQGLDVADRDPVPLRKLFSSLGLSISVGSSPAPTLGITLGCARGEVRLGPPSRP